MIHTLAAYLKDELTEWNNTIEFLFESISELEEKLQELLQQDSIPKLAAKVEHYITVFLLQKQTLAVLLNDLQKQEASLSNGHMPVDNELLTADIKARQNKLRDRMQEAEKEYVVQKYNCQKFLSEVIGGK